MVKKKYKNTSKVDLFAHLLLSVKFLRFSFFFYSFLCFLFWFLNCLEVDWLYLFNWLFIIPYKIVRLFYTPKGVSVDFSLAFIGMATIILGFLADFFVSSIYQIIENIKEEEQRKLRQRKNKKNIERNKILYSETKKEISDFVPLEPEKLIFLLSININKIKKTETDTDLSYDELELWKQRVIKKLVLNLQDTNPMQKGYYRKNLFLVYKNFNYADKFLYFLNVGLQSIVNEFKQYKIRVSFSFVISALNITDNMEKELDLMDTIILLNFVNEFVVTNKFKCTYKAMETQKYDLLPKGEFNLSKHLSISNRQMVYVLTNK